MPPDTTPLSLTAMPAASFVRLLQQTGSQYTDEHALAADRAAGAPFKADGSIDVIAYAAWLISGECS